MPDHIPYLRIFLSSPGDVNEERKIAIEVIEALPYRPAFRDKVAFRVIAWDRPGADTPMLASLTPQEAINRGLPKPSECDITLVIFWKRMGTPFVDLADSQAYESGTHWELLDALKNPGCETLIFHRTEEVMFKASDKAGQEQYERVQQFFGSEVFYKDGRILRGVNQYAAPEDFRLKMQTFMEDVVLRILETLKKRPLTPEPTLPVSPNIVTVEKADWPPDQSPFPGLRAFTAEDAPIFFGRGVEISELVKRVEASRFVAVVAASGSGKSSLVAAGLIPRLKANAISNETTGSKDWFVCRFTPGRQPFEALADALMDVIPALACADAIDYPDKLERLTGSLSKAPERLSKTLTHALKNEKAWADVLLFIDQFEELFTLAKGESIVPFAQMLLEAVASPRVRVVITVRHDFVHRAIEIPELAKLLNLASFNLASPTVAALAQMVKRPAELAALEFEAGLPEHILSEMGSDAGALALLAYTLDELYKIADKRHDRRLTFVDYEALGGVQGAIGKRAEQTYQMFAGTDDEKKALLGRVFRELVTVDERAVATRQHCSIERFDAECLILVHAFTDARLLVMDESQVEVAHEALFRSWGRLKDWIAEAQEDLILLRQVRNAAHDWQAKERPDYLLWPQERLTLVSAMQARLNPELNEVERDFIEPEQARLLREIETLPKTDTSHERRRDIGDRLAVIGDTRPGVGVKNGLPDIVWLPVAGSGGAYKFEFGEFEVKPFLMAKYQISYVQFQAFVEAADGFEDERWWEGMPDEYKKQGLDQQRTKIANAPRDTVSWYQAVAFTRWLDVRYRELNVLSSFADAVGGVPTNTSWQIRLPTEWEWQWAAQGGGKAKSYPWGEWQAGYANTDQAGLNRSTAVGMYPHGAAESGALDVAGNLWEWCLNDYGEPKIVNGFTNSQNKTLRGGSWYNLRVNARAAYRYYPYPDDRNFSVGFRVVRPPS